MTLGVALWVFQKFPGRISQIVAQATTRAVRDISVEVFSRVCMPATHLSEDERWQGYAIV